MSNLNSVWVGGLTRNLRKGMRHLNKTPYIKQILQNNLPNQSKLLHSVEFGQRQKLHQAGHYSLVMSEYILSTQCLNFATSTNKKFVNTENNVCH